MPTTKRLTLAAVLKPFARLTTTSTDVLDVRSIAVRTPSVTATSTFSLLYAEGDCYLHSVRFVPDTAANAADWSIQLQNAGTGGAGATAIGSAFTGALVAQDGANIYAPADGYSTVIKVGEVLKVVATRTAGTLDGVWQVNYIPIIV